MTAETTGKSIWISIFKDLDIVDILCKNRGNSMMICDQEDWESAIEHFGDGAHVWLHTVEHSNADNRICFKIAESSVWDIENGELTNPAKWPLPECQDVCRPCAGAD